ASAGSCAGVRPQSRSWGRSLSIICSLLVVVVREGGCGGSGGASSSMPPLSPAGREGKSSPLRAQFLPDPRRGLAIGRAKATAQVGAGADVLDGHAQAIAHPRQVGGGRLLDVVHREGFPEQAEGRVVVDV